MTLRLKALLAAGLTVASVTGLLGFWVSRQWEHRERERIESDLAVDAAELEQHLDLTRRLKSAYLARSTAERLDLRFFVRGRDREGRALSIASNFQPFVADWLEATQADVGLVALDSFDLSAAREAVIYGECGDLTVVEFLDARQGARGSVTIPLDNLAFESWLHNSYEIFLDSPDPRSVVMPLGRSVWLVVAAPLHKDAGGVELGGVALLFKELTTAWIRAGRGAVDTGVRHLIHNDGHVAGHTLVNSALAQRVVEARTGGVFEVDLGSKKVPERWIARDAALEAGSTARFIALKNLEVELVPLQNLLIWLWRVGLGLGVVGTAEAYALALRVVRRLDVLRRQTERVRQGDFEAHVPEQGRDEITLLGKAFNRMTAGLKALGLYTDPVIARAILDDSAKSLVQGGETEGTVLFTDIADFTTVSEQLDPKDLVARLNDYFMRVGEAVHAEGGYLDKFIGDAVMAWWGDPFLSSDVGPEGACRAALAIQRAVEDFNRAGAAKGWPPFKTRIGLAYGSVVVGNLGSAGKKNFTVIGDTANLASRLEGANKMYGTTILVEAEIKKRAPGLRTREVDTVIVKGREGTTTIHEILGLAGTLLSPEKEAALEAYDRALAGWRTNDVAEALKFVQTHEKTDGPSAWLAGRCREVLSAGEASGVTRLTSK